MNFAIDTTQTVDFSSRLYTFELSGNRVVTLERGFADRVTLSLIDASGTVVSEDATVVPSTASNTYTYTPWHVREDTDGAFTVFVSGASGQSRDFNNFLVSFDAEGTLTNSGTYEPLDFDKPQGNAAIDVEEGRVVAVVNVGNRVETRLFEADGTISNEGLWNTNETGAGSARGENLNFSLTRAGDSIFVFIVNDDNHNPFFIDESLVLARLELNGDPINFGTTTPVDLPLPILPSVVPRDTQSEILDSATLSDGKVVLVYAMETLQDVDSNRLSGDDDVDVFMRLFNADGTEIGTERRINEFVLGEQSSVGVTALEAGGFVVTYHNDAPDPPRFPIPDFEEAPFEGPRDTVIFRLYDNDGTPISQSEAPADGILGDRILFPDGTGYLFDFSGAYRVTTDLPEPPEPPRNETGGDGPDSLEGGNGNDTLAGGPGDDRIQGGPGDDDLIGGTGADRMEGGLGNDSYSVDNRGDVVRDSGGLDTLQTTVNFNIRNTGVEEVVAQGTDDIRIVGDRTDTRVTGNDGDNILLGGGGNDTLTGGAGADSFAFIRGTGPSNALITDFGLGDVLALDDQFFGLGNGRIDPREMSPQDVRGLLRDGLADFNTQTLELSVDTDGPGGDGGLEVIATFTRASVQELGIDDILIF